MLPNATAFYPNIPYNQPIHSIAAISGLGPSRRLPLHWENSPEVAIRISAGISLIISLSRIAICKEFLHRRRSAFRVNGTNNGVGPIQSLELGFWLRDCYPVRVQHPANPGEGGNAPNAPRYLLLRLAYDGTDFYGWQIQPDRPTIQGHLTEALVKISCAPVHLHGAGRTDAGVHACAQAASVKLHSPIPCANLVQALNDHLPESIRVLSAQAVPPEFHARRSARSKVYRYRIYREKLCAPWLARYVYPYPYPLDEAAMSRAARQVEGRQDFRSFASAVAASKGAEANEEKSTVRTIFSSTLEREKHELVYTVEGSGFLNHMVRNMVGTLIELGRGKIPSDGIPRILAARHRSAAGPTAPARGLHLMQVCYPELSDEQMPSITARLPAE